MHTLSAARVLHFDIENRPLSYWCDRPSAEVTAIAWSWAGESRVHCWLLDKDGSRCTSGGITSFLAAYMDADIITGHYIRKHDLPIINGMLIEEVVCSFTDGKRKFSLGMKCLPPKLTSDTRLDLPKLKDLPVSQEALGEYLGVKAPKVHMTQPAWRDANRLTDSGLAKTYKRCVSDVIQHKGIRAELIKRGLLRGPRTWRPM